MFTNLNSLQHSTLNTFTRFYFVHLWCCRGFVKFWIKEKRCLTLGDFMRKDGLRKKLALWQQKKQEEEEERWYHIKTYKKSSRRPSDQSVSHQQMPARLNGCNDLSNHYTALLIVSSRYLSHQYGCRYWSIPRRGARVQVHLKQASLPEESFSCISRFYDLVRCKIMRSLVCFYRLMVNKQDLNPDPSCWNNHICSLVESFITQFFFQIRCSKRSREISF